MAIAERVISRAASQRLAHCAVEVAKARGARRITLVHKANVLPLTCGLFRDSCREVLIMESTRTSICSELTGRFSQALKNTIAQLDRVKRFAASVALEKRRLALTICS